MISVSNARQGNEFSGRPRFMLRIDVRDIASLPSYWTTPLPFGWPIPTLRTLSMENSKDIVAEQSLYRGAEA
jgi:hypothetical protein